jgi:energy-coupling factor transporter ATP-binding protein EcfA2
MTELLARASAVTRRYGDTVALDGGDLDVPAGTMTGLLGPNGAGKSTLLSLLVGLRRPDSGRIELFGGSPQDAANRRQLGMTPQETGLPATLRVAEVVAFVARHHPDPLPTGELLERFGLSGLERRQTGGCRVGRSGASPWGWRSWAGRGWWSWTSRRRVWTSRPGTRCGPGCVRSTPTAAPCCSPPTTSRRSRSWRSGS